MKQVYKFKKAVGPKDWRALPREFAEGEVVVRFNGHTYGLDRDDLVYGNGETIPCVVDGREAFFTVPVEFLEDEKGNQPSGNYVKIERKPRE